MMRVVKVVGGGREHSLNAHIGTLSMLHMLSVVTGCPERSLVSGGRAVIYVVLSVQIDAGIAFVNTSLFPLPGPVSRLKILEALFHALRKSVKRFRRRNG